MKANLLIFALAAAVASAATINTGVNNANGLLAGGSPDPHFTLTGGGTAVVPTILPSSLYYTSGGNSLGTATAEWIASSLGNAAPIGNYTFAESISGVTSISGIWATDNCGSISVTGGAATITGGTIGGAPGSCNGSTNNFHVPTAFTISGLSAATTYTLNFNVINTDGPVGLLVDTGAATTPEPSSILSIMTGLGVVGFAIRRRQAAK